MQVMNAERRNCMKIETIAQHMAVFCLLSPQPKKVVQRHQAIYAGWRNQKDTKAWITQDEGRGKKNINPLNICDYQVIVV